MSKEFETKKLMEDRAVVVTQMQEMAKRKNESGEAFTSEEAEKWDKLEAAEKDYTSKIETAKRLQRSASLFEEKPDNTQSIFSGYKAEPENKSLTYEEQNQVFRSICFNQMGRSDLITNEMAELAKRGNISGNVSSLVGKSTVKRAMSTDASSGAEGGHTLNDSLVAGVEKILVSYGGMLNAAKIYPTDDGGARHWAIYNDTSNVGAIIAENSDTTSDDISFSKKSIPVYTFRTAVYPISLELLQDSEAPILEIVGDAVGERLARGLNTYLTTGDSTGEPEGCLTASAEGWQVTDGTAADSNLTFTDIIKLEHSIDPLYRRNGKLMFHDSTLSHLKQEVDSTTGRPLWMPSFVTSAPDRIMGYEYIVNNDMPQLGTTDKKVVLFGDFSRYVARRARSVEIMVLKERYAEKLAVGVMAFSRWGGGLLTNKAVKHIVTPSS